MDTPSLLDLYRHTSKHSHYQVLPDALTPLLGSAPVPVQSRFEHERWAYVLSRVPLAGLHVADIGGNTGFFSFEALRHGARRVDYYEGNAAHHDFVRAAAQELRLDDALRTHHRYLSFDPPDLPLHDCTLLLNVLHHLGDDFGDPGVAKAVAMQRMLDCLVALSRTSLMLVFQLGFNWKGDRHQPLFEGGTKSEMIEFIRHGTSSDWAIHAIGVAQREEGKTVFRDMSEKNIARDDSLGEFLNRPLFIMRSRHAGPSSNPIAG